jgi:hypothetical protein
MGETQAEVSVIGQFVAQLVARKRPMDQKKYPDDHGLAEFPARPWEICPEGSSYSRFLDATIQSIRSGFHLARRSGRIPLCLIHVPEPS